MIAEDNTELCKSCFEFLTNDEEIKVISCAEDGEETLKKYLEIQPDVLLLDLNLPKMSGIDVINKLDSNLEERKKCNIVVFSGNFEYMHQLYNTAKIYRVLPKPVNFDYILKTIKEVPIKEKEINLDANKLETIVDDIVAIIDRKLNDMQVQLMKKD